MLDTQPWVWSHRADPLALRLADAHYNRQKPGTQQFVPPGRCLVFLTEDLGALWVSSWPFPEYVKHRWPGAWICSCFRRERGPLASELVLSAVAATRAGWGDPPPLGMVTFVDRNKTKTKRDPGRCFRKAGFRPDGETVGGLVALRLWQEDFPTPIVANRRGIAGPLFAEGGLRT